MREIWCVVQEAIRFRYRMLAAVITKNRVQSRTHNAKENTMKKILIALTLGSLLCVAISTIFLIAPAAYHRIAENGEDSEEFYEISGRMLLFALFWLGLGIAADLWVVLERMTQSSLIAWIVSAATLLFFYGIWFGYSAVKRREKTRVRLAS